MNYYDYKNIFVVGSQKRIEEYYGKGGFDPIEMNIRLKGQHAMMKRERLYL